MVIFHYINKGDIKMEQPKEVLVKLNPELGVEFNQLAKELNMKKAELVNFLVKFYKMKKD